MRLVSKYVIAFSLCRWGRAAARHYSYRAAICAARIAITRGRWDAVTTGGMRVRSKTAPRPSALMAGKWWWRSDIHEQCDTCSKMCPQQATPMAQTMSADDVLRHIRKASLLFIEGITAAERRPRNWPFIVALFLQRSCRSAKSSND